AVRSGAAGLRRRAGRRRGDRWRARHSGYQTLRAPPTHATDHRVQARCGIRTLGAVRAMNQDWLERPVTDQSAPGDPPFTRGIYPTMYRGKLWTMRQYAGFGTAEETNARFRYLLEHGQTGLSVAFELPTQMGYDADDEQVAGEVGKVGVSISSLADLERLFAGIPLDKVTTSMTINATAAILLAMYAAVAKRQGVPLARIGGTTQNDIL